jgi:hypothetical protein
MTVPRRLLVAPLLTLVLSAWPLSATTSGRRPPETWRVRAGMTGWLSEAWTLMNRNWRNPGSSVGFLEKAGGSTDPFGNPAPTTVQSLPAITPPEVHPAGK